MPITTPHIATPDLQAAVDAVLIGNTAFTSLSAGPFAKVPTNQPFPYTAFGRHREDNWYVFQNTGRQVTFVFDVWSQKSFAEAYAIVEAITGALETQTLTLSHFVMAQNDFIFESVEQQEEPDGITFYVTARYKTHLTAK